MTYHELLRKTSRRRELKRNKVFLDEFIALLKKTVRKQGRFIFPDFLSFTVRKIKARDIINPQTGKLMHLAATKTVKVKAAASWRSE